jgi:hypothetical protein
MEYHHHKYGDTSEQIDLPVAGWGYWRGCHLGIFTTLKIVRYT